MLKDVVASGAVAEVELLKLNRDVVKLKGDIAKARKWKYEVNGSLLRIDNDHRSIALDFSCQSTRPAERSCQQISAIEWRKPTEGDHAANWSEHKSLAPIDGTVKEVFVRTIGGVVRPGEPLLWIIPSNIDLIVEARISPQDVAFVPCMQDWGQQSNSRPMILSFMADLKAKLIYVECRRTKTEDGMPIIAPYSS